MTTLREAAEKGLRALRVSRIVLMHPDSMAVADAAIAALEAALEQPDPYILQVDALVMKRPERRESEQQILPAGTAIYTHPPVAMQPEQEPLPEFCTCDETRPMECEGCRINRERWGVDSSRAAAVAKDFFWREFDADTPRGVKLLLLGKGGVASLGQYAGPNKDQFWTHWAPLPKRKPG